MGMLNVGTDERHSPHIPDDAVQAIVHRHASTCMLTIQRLRYLPRFLLHAPCHLWALAEAAADLQGSCISLIRKDIKVLLAFAPSGHPVLSLADPTDFSHFTTYLRANRSAWQKYPAQVPPALGHRVDEICSPPSSPPRHCSSRAAVFRMT